MSEPSTAQDTARVIVPGEGPFSPAHVLIATLMAGLAGGGLLAALNWERLGHPARKWLTLAGGIAASLLLAGSALALYAASGQVAFVLLALLVNAAGGIGLVYWQHEAYTDWVARYGLPTAEQIALRPGMVLVGGVLFVELCLLLPLALSTALPAIRAAGPARPFTGPDLALAYPADWQVLDMADQPACQQAQLTCLLNLRGPSGRVVFDVIRRAADTSVGEADALAAAAAALLDVDGVADMTDEALTVDGQPARRLTYRLPNPFTPRTDDMLSLWRVLALHDGAIIQFSAQAPDRAALADSLPALESILASVRWSD